MGVNSSVGAQGKGMASKYHDEKMLQAPASPSKSMTNADTLPPHSGGAESGLNPGNMENPMMKMSGGGKVSPAAETNMGNPMMKMSGGSQGELPSQGEVYASNPQGHKSAPLAGKLKKYR